MLWGVDAYLEDGFRFRKQRIPTQRQAVALLAKHRSDAFEGRYFDKPKTARMTVKEAWDFYRPASKVHNSSHQTDLGRAKHLVRQMGREPIITLCPARVDSYREARRLELTVRGGPPTDATLDRELALLKRIINWAVRNQRIWKNPLAGVKPLNTDNTRSVVIDEEDLSRLLAKSPEFLRPFFVLYFDTGMRSGELLKLRRNQVDLQSGRVDLGRNTKTRTPRTFWLTQRASEVLASLPRPLNPNAPLFQNPHTGRAYVDLKKSIRKALDAAGLTDAWLHDLRRSYVTNARRRGIEESVIMKQTGHKTHSVFRRYSIIEDSDLKEAARKFEAGSVSETERMAQEKK